MFVYINTSACVSVSFFGFGDVICDVQSQLITISKEKKEFLISVVINAYQCNNRIASIACIYNDDMHAYAHTNTELDFASSRQKILTH